MSAVEAGTLGLLVFAPLAYGTVEPWSEAIVGVVVVLTTLAWTLEMALRDRALRVALPPGWLPGALFLLLVLLQTAALPAGWVGWLSPGSSALAVQAHQFVTGGLPSVLALSLDAPATAREGLRLGGAAASFLLAYNLYQSRARADRALWAMALTSTLVAVFGVVQRQTWNGRLYWIGPEAPHTAGFGPFVNRAHFVGLVVVVLPMVIALAAGRWSEARVPRTGACWVLWLRRWGAMGPACLLPCLGLVIGGVAVTSGSRGGLVALLFALIAMAALGLAQRAGRTVGTAAAGAAALVLLLGVALGLETLVDTAARLLREAGAGTASDRARLWVDALELWRGAAAFGVGLGAFGAAFGAARTVASPALFTHAESDWMQLLTETGLVGLGLAGLALAAVGAALVRRSRRSAAPAARALAIGGTAALLGTAVHGVANFSLAVTSHLLYLALAVALALRYEDGVAAEVA